LDEKRQKEALEREARERIVKRASLVEKFKNEPKDPKIKLVFKISDTRIEKNFCLYDKLEEVFDFLESNQIPVEKYQLVIPYPRKTFSLENKDVKLVDLGFEKGQVLHVAEI
jgi:hypothetical protein